MADAEPLAPALAAPAAAATGDAPAEQTSLQTNRVYWAKQKGFTHVVYDAYVYVPPPPNSNAGGQIRNIFNSKLCSSKQPVTRLVDSFIGVCTPAPGSPARARSRAFQSM